jgi:hypothetical protein
MCVDQFNPFEETGEDAVNGRSGQARQTLNIP